jgi:hypothetical protein
MKRAMSLMLDSPLMAAGIDGGRGREATTGVTTAGCFVANNDDSEDGLGFLMDRFFSLSLSLSHTTISDVSIVYYMEDRQV